MVIVTDDEFYVVTDGMGLILCDEFYLQFDSL